VRDVARLCIRRSHSTDICRQYGQCYGCTTTPSPLALKGGVPYIRVQVGLRKHTRLTEKSYLVMRKKNIGREAGAHCRIFLRGSQILGAHDDEQTPQLAVSTWFPIQLRISDMLSLNKKIRGQWPQQVNV